MSEVTKEKTVANIMEKKPAKRPSAFYRHAFVLLVLVSALFLQSETALANPKYSGIVIDAKSGKTLYADNADILRYPASLTKVMTLYLLFEELDSGRMNLDTRLKVSNRAATQPPSKIGIRPGHPITVRTAIRALVVKSANDVAYAVGENIGGSERKFATLMTRKAREIGMKNTTFQNAHGLPNKNQKTTARDMVILGRAIQERFPEQYKFFSTRTFKFRGRTYSNTNRLLGRVKGVNGIKTGYIRASGFNLITSVQRNNKHIIAVVMGGRSSNSRNKHMIDLINRYFGKATKKNKTSYVLTASQRNPNEFTNLALYPSPRRKPKLNTLLALFPESKESSDLEELLNKVSEAGNRPRTPKATEVASTDSTKPSGNTESTPAAIQTVPIISAEKSESQSIPPVKDSVQPVGGWQVQIAATPSKNGAIELLETAKSKVGNSLQQFAAYTEPVSTGNGTHYRARFVGFDSKAQAWNACKALKKAKYRCYAIFE